MAELTLEELAKRVQDRKTQVAAIHKKRYHLARDLGFSSDEAVILQNRTEATIRRLAAERKGKT